MLTGQNGRIANGRDADERTANGRDAEDQVAELSLENGPQEAYVPLGESAPCASTRAPLIAVVPNADTTKDAVWVRNNYLRAVLQAGGSPFVLPLSLCESLYEGLFPLVDGFLLTGGVDIDPARYVPDQTMEHLASQLHPHARHIRSSCQEATPVREEVESLVLSYARRFDVPLLGVCRGMQVMNVFYGGTLHLDLALRDAAAPQVRHWQDEPYDGATHAVTLKRGSRLGKVHLQAFGKTAVSGEEGSSCKLQVNSMHHQGVREVSPLFEVVACADDGLPEAIEMVSHDFMVGVQWHPEYLNDPFSKQLFAEFVAKARQSRAKRLGCPAVDAMLHIVRNEIPEAQWPQVSFEVTYGEYI